MRKVKVNILLIDDDPHFLSLTWKTLERISYLDEINCIKDIKEAREYLDACKQNKHAFPDIIFLDIQMPVIGGMEFAELYCLRYAEQYPETKLVMLSASIRRKDKVKALGFPAVTEWMEKPLTEDKLKSLIP